MRGTRLWLVIGLVALFALGLVAAGCGDDDDTRTRTTSASGGGEDLGLITEGTLLVGARHPVPAVRDRASRPTSRGYDIEVLNAIAENLGLTAEYQDTSFDTIFRDVAAGQFDIAAAASTITPGRQKTSSTSPIPTTRPSRRCVVPEGSDIASVDDLAGTIVGAQDGTTGEDLRQRRDRRLRGARVPRGPGRDHALLTGQVDAAIIDQPVAADAVEKQGGHGDRRGDPDQRALRVRESQDNHALRRGDRTGRWQTIKDDGTIAELYEKYFARRRRRTRCSTGRTSTPDD